MYSINIQETLYRKYYKIMYDEDQRKYNHRRDDITLETNINLYERKTK